MIDSRQNTEIVGSVLRIERTSIHDGRGLRTVLFLKGCPLSCRWCSTPESQRPNPERGYDRNRCSGCGQCVRACPEAALSMAEDGPSVVLDASRCKNCFLCAERCPNRAIKRYGSSMAVREAVREISKDEIFYFHSGGGITVSGGEPLRQPEFVAELLRECREQGIHTAMETSFYAPYGSIEKVLPWLDVLYVDVKMTDGESHREWTGVDNALILENIRRADRSGHPLELFVRIPMVPGANDSDCNLSATAEFCRSLTKLKEVELLAYHRLGTDSYRLLGREYSLKGLVPPTRERILERAGFLARQNPGVPVRVGGGFAGSGTIPTGVIA